MPHVETRKFDAEVGKILQLMIHSLYTNRDIFLRELISNASDACDKLRYQAITEPALLEGNTELAINISFDPKARTVTIADNGIGMNRDDLIENLGTIARSGTQNFLQQLTGDNKRDMQLIGQFGVGFYSSFMVADSVTVISRKAGETQSWQWQSKGDGEFSIAEAESRERGTSVTLHLREGEDQYLDKFRLEHIITTYSDHIAFPIKITDEEGNTQTVNKAAALWMRPKSEVTEAQYQEFYKHVAHLPDQPWMTLHGKAEGAIEYSYLLFVPSRKPFDLFHPDRRTRVKLYVKRVYITDEGLELIPSYLRFLQGVVDSEDLPLNISRETLQNNATIAKIRRALTKKILSELKAKAEQEPEKYVEFWANFGAVLKEGLCEGGIDTREPLLEVCRFYSTKSDGKLISLDEYITRMKDDQQTIYYLSGDSLESLKNSPQLEGFVKQDIEVILLTDTVDDFWVNVVHEYKEKELKSVTRAGIELDKTEQAEKKDNKEQDKLIAFFKETLGAAVADVRISHKLTDSPVCLVVPEGAMDIRMERFLIDQKQLASASAKILEINPEHPVITKLAADVGADDSAEVVRLLFDQARIVEGEPITDPGAFSKRLNVFLQKALAA